MIKKGTAYIIGLVLLMVIFGSMYVHGVIIRDMKDVPTIAIIAAIVSLTGGFIGLQVANNGVKGKTWNQAMYDSENKEEGNESTGIR